MAADEEKEDGESLDENNIGGVEEVGSSEGVFQAKTVFDIEL